ncbi:RusA family crossover junction endodeoxyribonuclease [Candidatus Bathyarchaeota archaeon]|nr:RusA family crossover junction endodeoxyribonuclease [Candidatus Bathyarchaeota archaeon]
MSRTAALRREVEHKFLTLLKHSIRLSITYHRQKGKSDAVNIIGGIADALNGIAYDDDSQITQINYQETKGSFDEYTIIVEEV